MSFLQFILTLCAALPLGLLLNRIRFPGGLLFGGMIGAALFNILTSCAYVPAPLSAPVQIVAGAFVGCSMEKSDVKRLPKLWRPALILLSSFLVLNFVCGFLIYRYSSLNAVTAFMSAVPGGLSDTPIIAHDMGAEGSKVALLQLVRLILGIGILPSLIALVLAGEVQDRGREVNLEVRRSSKTDTWQALFMTLLVSSILGLLGRASGIPAGTFCGALIAALLYKLFIGKTFLPRSVKKAMQVLSGALIGSTMTMQNVRDLPDLIIPCLIVITAYTLNSFLNGYLLNRFCGFTKKEGMLISTPAGASDMALIAEDIGVKNTDVLILQVFRLICVMAVFPQFIALLLWLTGWK
jgi:membrane AbrB-like protein